ncbi:MAG: hypothetical protein H6Q15_428 [Bacteroidetes bacterium]|nr:hypothetical protein [Bacteroidota bacterium]
MKKGILLLTLVILSINTFAQINKSIVDTTKVWSTIYTYTPYIVRTYKYKFSGDSMINGQKYYKVFQTSLHVNDENNYSFSGIYLREDSNIVYCFEAGTESILYNFNLNKGDSISLISRRIGNRVGEHLSVVDSVDTVYIDNTALKRIHLLNYGSREILIQGIGNLSGLFESGHYYELSSDLVCLEQAGELIYKNDYYDNCYEFVGLEDINNDNIQLKIYPTIIDNTLNIESSEYPLNLSIVDIFGKEIFSEKILSNRKIDCSNLKVGTYFCKIRDIETDKTVVIKILKR